jgi:hypothetical protein
VRGCDRGEYLAKVSNSIVSLKMFVGLVKSRNVEAEMLVVRVVRK